MERNTVIKRNEWTQEAFILKRKQKKMASLTQDMGKALGGTRSSDGRFIDHGDGTFQKTGEYTTGNNPLNIRRF